MQPAHSMQLQVFLADTPFQVLNSFEARTAYGGNADIPALFAVTKLDSGRMRQIRAIFARFGPCQIFWMAPNEPVQPLVSHVTKELGIGRDATQLFMSTNQSVLQRKRARALSTNRPVLLDDGAGTLLVANRRRQKLWRMISARREHGGRRRSLRRPPALPGILRDVMLLPGREFSSVEFFSIYALKAGRLDTWRPNRMTLLQDLRCTGCEKRTPIIAGSAVVEAGLVRESGYHRLIGRMLRDCSPLPLYIAHPGEADDKLDRLAQHYALEIIRPKYSIELELIDRRIVPDPLLTTLSTSMDTLRVVFPKIEVRAFRPAVDDVVKSWPPGSIWKKVALAIRLQEEASLVVGTGSHRCEPDYVVGPILHPDTDRDGHAVCD